MLSKNFSLRELTYSATAVARRLSNNPGPAELANLEKLCKEVLQPIREKYGAPIKVNSGYRSPAVNAAVGGAKGSAHLNGTGADIKVTSGSNAKLYEMIRGMVNSGTLTVGQCIWEKGTSREPRWIHISLPSARHKNEFFRLR